MNVNSASWKQYLFLFESDSWKASYGETVKILLYSAWILSSRKMYVCLPKYHATEDTNWIARMLMWQVIRRLEEETEMIHGRCFTVTLKNLNN